MLTSTARGTAVVKAYITMRMAIPLSSMWPANARTSQGRIRKRFVWSSQSPDQNPAEKQHLLKGCLRAKIPLK